MQSVLHSGIDDIYKFSCIVAFTQFTSTLKKRKIVGWKLLLLRGGGGGGFL